MKRLILATLGISARTRRLWPRRLTLGKRDPRYAYLFQDNAPGIGDTLIITIR